MNDRTQDPIIVERVFAASPKAIWRALTDKHEMKQWYFDLPDFKPEVGFRFSFTGGPSPERQYVHLCEITESIPCVKLSYTWCYEGYTGESIVSFELIPQAEKTLLRLTHAGLHTFPRENPDLARHNFEAGWDDIVNRSLETYVGSRGQVR
jgi:uncharacterized protein YndB with AHSA1/START domain